MTRDWGVPLGTSLGVLSYHWQIQGATRDTPSQSKFFPFHAVYGNNFAKKKVTLPPLGVGATLGILDPPLHISAISLDPLITAKGVS